ncbi:hypothetical protein ACHAWF_005227 [Thalassiosira exigua]
MGRNRHGKGTKKKRGKPPKNGGMKPPKKLRFQVGDRVECLAGIGSIYSLDAPRDSTKYEYMTGTVLAVWFNIGKPEDDVEFNVPYSVLLDDSRVEFVPEDTDFFVKTIPESWLLGHVAKVNKNWAEENDTPYTIIFDDTPNRNAGFWALPGFIRLATLRFNVGDRVICPFKHGNMPGTVVKLSVDSDIFQEGGVVPYLVRLDNGDLTEVIFDVDTDEYPLIRKSDAPPLVVQFVPGASVECKLNDKCEEWRQGIVMHSNEDWVKHNRPLYFINFHDGEFKEFWGPNDCIRASCISTNCDGLRNLSLNDEGSDDLFAPPPPRPDCPICFLPFPIDLSPQYTHLCCGKKICNGCIFAQTIEPDLNNSCPFCRTPKPRSGEEFLALCQKRVDLNDPVITFYMGTCYEHGWNNCPRDDKRAFELLIRAAELGSARGCFKFARIFNRNGDKSKNRYYLEKATKLGFAQARYYLGCLERDEGNIMLGLRHWKIAAAMGYQDALADVLRCYRQGMMSKAEFESILRSSQRAHEDEWSQERELANCEFQAENKDRRLVYASCDF